MQKSARNRGNEGGIPGCPKGVDGEEVPGGTPRCPKSVDEEEEMDRWEIGMLARSLAGHDKDRVYVIYSLEEAYVYLVDGENRTRKKPKKKKKKHVQLIRRKYDTAQADDIKIKRILKEYRTQERGMKEES